MDDFKSYTLSRQTPRRQVVKRLILAGLFLALLAIGFLYLVSHEDEPGVIDQEPPSQKGEAPRKIILPLNLPGQPKEGRRSLPDEPTKPVSFIRTAEAREPEPSPDIQPAPGTESGAGDTHSEEKRSSQWITHKIKHGESLSTIFKEYGLSANLLHRIVHSSETAGQLTDLRPGETLRLEMDQDEFLSLRLEHDKISSLNITAEADDFSASEEVREVEHRSAHTSGTIESSLYTAAKGAGLSETLIMELANIFGWDIDFALEIRAGDQFTVIYQEDYLDGAKLRDGPILAAEFVNRGRSYRALRYVDAEGHADYFTPDGHNMRKAFLRAPVDFRRISSKFARERWHPVLGKKRPHRGVDYAARIGTPVKASGDGKIVHRGTKGGYGKTVIIQHGQTYTTLYAHLSRYNKKARKGQRVKQGDVIGYVGKTGLATGPHLHYEFRVHGVHRNPITVKLPAADPINKKYLADFQMKIQPLLAQLETISRTLVANAQ